MTRDKFKKVMFSPYFQTDHYQNDTNGGKAENKISIFLIKLKDVFFRPNK